MSINPGVGYSVTNLGKAVSLDIETYLPEQEPKQFECSIVRKGGETPEYHLRVRKGLIEFDYIKTDENGLINPETYGTREDITSGSATPKTHCFMYANRFNLYPTGTLVSNGNSTIIRDSEFLDNGYIKLTEGKSYYLFVYKTVPDWGGPAVGGPPEGVPEARAPQIGIQDISEPVVDINPRESGCGSLQFYFRTEDKFANHWLGNPEAFYASGLISGIDPYTGVFYAFAKEIDTGSGKYYTNLNEDNYVRIRELYLQGEPVLMGGNQFCVGYRNTDVIRKDIAYIRWNEGLKRFQIFQINYGPISIRQINPPLISANLLAETPLYNWTNTGRDLVNDIVGDIDGYTKTPNGFNSISRSGMIDIGGYQKPFETA